MKKFIYLLVAVIFISINGCDKVLIDDMTLQDVTGGNKYSSGQAAVVDHTAIPNFVPCEPYTVDLIIHNDPWDLWGKTSVKVGTMAVTNDNDNLYLDFNLDADLVQSGCYLSKISVYIRIFETYEGKWSPIRREIQLDLGQSNLSSYRVTVPRVYFYQGRFPSPQDYSFNCGDNLIISSYVQICCPSGGFGSGTQTQYTINNGSYPMYYGNNDTYVGTLNVSIINNNLVITYQTINNIELEETHIHISNANCSFPNAKGNPIPGQFTYGSHKGQGQFLNNNTQYTINIPLSDLETILGSSDLCNAEFCVLAHAELKNGETMFAGENKVTGKGRWYRYFKFTINCPPFGGGPECFDAWSHGNARICFVTEGLFPDRYWYFAILGYIFCCE